MREILTVALVAIALLVGASQYVKAQTADVAVPCTPIAVAGNIVVSRCVPDEGYPFLVNSFGFMLWEE